MAGIREAIERISCKSTPEELRDYARHLNPQCDLSEVSAPAIGTVFRAAMWAVLGRPAQDLTPAQLEILTEIIRKQDEPRMANRAVAAEGTVERIKEFEQVLPLSYTHVDEFLDSHFNDREKFSYRKLEVGGNGSHFEVLFENQRVFNFFIEIPEECELGQESDLALRLLQGGGGEEPVYQIRCQAYDTDPQRFDLLPFRGTTASPSVDTRGLSITVGSGGAIPRGPDAGGTPTGMRDRTTSFTIEAILKKFQEAPESGMVELLRLMRSAQPAERLIGVTALERLGPRATPMLDSVVSGILSHDYPEIDLPLLRSLRAILQSSKGQRLFMEYSRVVEASGNLGHQLVESLYQRTLTGCERIAVEAERVFVALDDSLRQEWVERSRRIARSFGAAPLGGFEPFKAEIAVVTATGAFSDLENRTRVLAEDVSSLSQQIVEPSPSFDTTPELELLADVARRRPHVAAILFEAERKIGVDGAESLRKLFSAEGVEF